MHLSSPESAILSAVIFNAIIIVVLVPLALRGVKFRAIGAGALLRRNLLIYGLGGIIAPFAGIKAIDVSCCTPFVSSPEPRLALRDHVMIREIRPALSLVVFFTIAMGFFLPAVFTEVAQVIFPFQAGGSLISQDGKVVGSAIIGQNFTGPTWFNTRPSALSGTDAKGNSISTPYDDSESGASNLAPSSAALARPR